MTLDPGQRNAVEHTSGPLVVVAGPGTGKTRVITEKVVHLARDQGVAPARILALTFTEKAAAQMQHRIAKALQAAGIRERPRVQNFHSFCLDLVMEHHGLLGYDERPELLAGPLYVQFIADHVDELPVEHWDLRGGVSRFARALADFVGFCHDEGIAHADLATKVDAWLLTLPESSRDAKRKVLDLVRSVPVLLDLQRRAHVLSYGDLLTDALRLLEGHAELLAVVQRQFDQVLVDEFQDNDRAQFDLVNLLAARHGRVTVVGDEDQSIYRFRGAATGLMRAFHAHWTGAGFTVHSVGLEENYRSSDAIIALSQDLIAHNALRDKATPLRKAAKSAASGPAETTLTLLADEADEAQHVTLTIIEAIGEPGRKPGDIAVLCRSLGHVTDIVSGLRRLGVPVEVVGGRRVFDDAVVREVHAWLKALDDPAHSEAELHRVLRFHHHALNASDVRALARAATEDRRPLLDVLRTAATGTWPKLTDDGRARIRGFLAHHDELHDHIAPQVCPDLVDLIDRIVDAGGLRARLRPTTARGRASLAAVGGLLDAAKRFQVHFPRPSLHGFLDHLDLRLQLGLDDERAEPSEDPDAVKVMTIHQAKGREYPIVVIAGLMDRFPSAAPDMSERQFLDHLTLGDDARIAQMKLEEERRLLYVALTRAKERLHLSATRTRNGKEPRTPSPFFEEILASSRIRRVEIPAGHVPTAASRETAGILTRDAAEARLHHLVSRLGARTEAAHDGVALLHESISLLAGLVAHADGDADAIQGELRRMGLPDKLHVPADAVEAIPGYDGPLRLSASAANTYTECPRRFYYGHVLRIPTVSEDAAALGSAVHKALERHVKGVLAASERQLHPDQIDTLMRLVEEETKSFPFDAENERAQLLVKLREVLQTYLTEESNAEAELHAAEEVIEVELDEGVTFVAKVDRIDTTPDGKLRITDYKHKNKLGSRPELLERNHQVALYAWAVQEKLAKPLHSVEVVNVKNTKTSGKAGTTTDRIVFLWEAGKPKDALTQQHVARARQHLGDIVTATRAGRFDATPSADTCKYCAYKLLCADAWGTQGGE
jgi:DNA helicase-2/ATP-dependent DNA helicase PcrA